MEEKQEIKTERDGRNKKNKKRATKKENKEKEAETEIRKKTKYIKK